MLEHLPAGEQVGITVRKGSIPAKDGKEYFNVEEHWRWPGIAVVPAAWSDCEAPKIAPWLPDGRSWVISNWERCGASPRCGLLP
jgi:hypothetical protein